jgi:Tol biopolymer transport system component
MASAADREAREETLPRNASRKDWEMITPYDGSDDERGDAEMKRAITLFVAVAMAAGLLALPLGSAEAAFPGSNGEIIFSSNRATGALDIFAISPAGGAPDRLTTFSTGHNIDPAVSPDGSRIAFVHDNQIWVMKASGMTAGGTGATRITDTSTAKTKPTWSPDGSRIAYVANSADVDGQTDLEIWVINADGSGRTQLTNNTVVPDDQPAWSPDGTKIAFVSTRTGDNNRNIYVMDANGNNQTDITQDGPYEDTTYQGHDDHPSWSPDGLTIAYTHTFLPNASGVPNIWTMTPTGSGKDNLQNDQNSSGSEPTWSPGGDKIAYVGVASASTNRDIHMMDANGANQKTVETEGNAANDISPDWQPASPTCDITGTSGNDTALTGTTADETICGLGGNDVINGGGGNDILMGGTGNDMLVAASGRATLNGGDSVDTASFAGSATPIEASLVRGFARRATTDPLEGAALVGIERLTGSSLGDSLIGSAGANVLVGGTGPDILSGLGGRDTLKSRDGAKNDTVNGGPGTDKCTTDNREISIKSCE